MSHSDEPTHARRARTSLQYETQTQEAGAASKI